MQTQNQGSLIAEMRCKGLYILKAGGANLVEIPCFPDIVIAATQSDWWRINHFS